MPTYNPLVPSGTIPLNQDYQNLQDNFNQANVVMGVDHLPFDNATAQTGYHTAIHLVPVSTIVTNPPKNQPIIGYTATPGYGQVISAQIDDGINTDEALFYLTGGNRLIQLTRNFVPVANTNGYTMLPGGLILLWGFLNGSHAGFFAGGDTGTITFASSNIAFPNSCFSVWLQGGYVNPTPTGVINFSVRTASISKTKFDWAFVGSSGAYNTMIWVALGN